MKRSRDLPSIAGAASAAALAAGRAAAAGKPKKKGPVFDYPQEVAGIFRKIPAKGPKAAAEACSEMVDGGPKLVRLLVGLVGSEFGDRRGVKPKYALHGLVIWASRPGAGAERRMVAETLAGELAAGHSAELKAFICRQLQLCGRAEEAPALGTLLTEQRLCEPAAQGLLAIGGAGAAAALREALSGVKGKSRATIIKALGRLKDKKAAGAIRPAAGDADRDVRLMVFYALANMGDGASADIPLRAAARKSGFERTQAFDATLRLIRRLAEQGDTDAAQEISRRLLADAKAPHERCAAVHEMAMSLGVRAVGAVMAAMESGDLRLRVPAARTAVKLAQRIENDHRKEARKLLKRVREATKEKAVLQEAEMLLAKAGS